MINQLSNFEGISIIKGQSLYSFSDLENQIKLYISSLEHELSAKDVVILASDYDFYSISLLLALSKLECIIVPIVKTIEDEFLAKVKASEANKIIRFTDKGKLEISEISKSKSNYKQYDAITSIENAGIVLFSSGTSGVPKVMVHNFTDLLNSFKSPRKQRKLRFLLFLMFDHIGGLNTLLSCLNNGSTIIIPSDRNPENILRIIQNKEVQVLPTSPTFLNLLLMVENFDAFDLSSLRLVTYGTERMPKFLLEKLNAKLPKVKFLQTFGTSETGILKTKSKSSNSLFFKIDDEKVDYKIIENQLFLKSKTSVKEYKGLNSSKFSSDGWFATGDLVEVDVDNYIRVVGRISEVINVGGLKVLPKEVEDVVNTHPLVIDTTVFSYKNAITGEMVCVKVVIDKEADEISFKKELKLFCKKKLDKYKVPSKIIISKKIDATARFKKKI